MRYQIVTKSRKSPGQPGQAFWKQRQETYYADFSSDLRESTAGHDAVLPLPAVQLHSKHRVDQGLRKRKCCMDSLPHSKKIIVLKKLFPDMASSRVDAQGHRYHSF